MIDTVPLDAAGMVALLLTVVNLLMQQVVKPIVELTPLGKPIESQQHDTILRVLLIGMNLLAIVAGTVTIPQLMGLPWYDILGWALGQSMLSHAAYQWSQSKRTTPTSAQFSLGAVGSTSQNVAPPMRSQVISRSFRTVGDVALPQQPEGAADWMNDTNPNLRIPTAPPPQAPPPTAADRPGAAPEEAGR